MTRTQCFALGAVLAAIGAAAALDVIQVDPVLRNVSIGAVAVVCAIAAMIFFVCAFRE